MIAAPGAPRILHIHGSMAADSVPARRGVRLMNAFATGLHHSLVANDGEWGAADDLARDIHALRREDYPPLGGLPLPGRLQRIAKAMAGHDLVLSHGLGAIDAALAHTLYAQLHALPPLIHHEDGSDETVRERQRWRSRWSRRLGLGRVAALVVPTETLEGVALSDWQQPLGRVKLIRDGVDLERFTRAPKPDAIPRLLKRPGELWIGCIACPGSEPDLVALVQAMAMLALTWHLVLVGAADQSGAVRAAVARHGLDHRVHFAPGSIDRAAVFALSDIVVAARGPEPLPIAVIEAMAAARPVLAFDTGETARSLSPDNAGLLTGDTMAGALDRLAGDRFLRQRIGQANRARAEAELGEAAMIAAYRRLYSGAMGRNAMRSRR